MSENLDVIVIGGGQAGLASGWHLKQRGLKFVILDEQERAGGNWRNYYDSLTLFSPAAFSGLPGMPLPGSQSRYPQRDEMVEYLEQYSANFQLPLVQRTRVVQVDRLEDRFHISTADGKEYSSKAVIVATGAFSRPYIPEVKNLSAYEGRILHSADYRNVLPFRDQQVVVVGAANSAIQIAYELAAVANVTLATREAVRFFPQRIFGIDFHVWLKWTRLEKTRWLNDQSTPVLDCGKYREAIKSGKLRSKAMFTQATSTGVVWSSGIEEPVDAIQLYTCMLMHILCVYGFQRFDA